MDPKAILKRHGTMKTARQGSVENIWRDCYDYTFPLRGNGLEGTMLTPDSAQHKQAELMDGTAADSANILASNIMAGLTPANARWFALDVGNESDEERRWLDDAATLLWENIHQSNFDAEAFEACLDMVSAGQFALYIDEDRDKGGLAFEQWPLSSVYTGSTRSDGRPDVIHREYELSAEAAAADFGEDALPERIRKALERTPEAMFKFVHCLYPRTAYIPGAKMAKNLPIASCHIAVDEKHCVRESGYHEMPVVVPRWLRVPGSVYAVGPMYAALPDVRNLNELKAIATAGADIAVSGMWLGIDDGVLNPRQVKLGPRKIIVAADKDSFTELRSGANFELSEMLVAKLQQAIRKTLMADQLQPQDGPQMTATEVHVRVEMIRNLLGPIYGRLQAEYLRPMIERCFGLAYRAGIFPPIPDSLRGRAFQVKYVSPLARAQKLEEVTNMDRFENTLVLEAQADPSVLDVYDFDEAARIRAEYIGVPMKAMRTREAVETMRAARAQAQQEQGQAEVMQAGAMSAADAGGKALGSQLAGAA